MAKKCVKCDKEIPKHIWVDNKKRNLQRRKYCLDCSPFGLHNTGQLEKAGERRAYQPRHCTSCGKLFVKKKGKLCYTCAFGSALKTRMDKVYNVVGESCWLCGYNKGEIGRKVLNFHHIDPSNKCMDLTSREMKGYAWPTVVLEIKKCVLLCCRCHQEYHAGLIPDEIMVLLYERKWKSLIL